MGSQIDGLDRFLEMYLRIVESLSVMKGNVDGSWNCSASDADSYHIILENFFLKYFGKWKALAGIYKICSCATPGVTHRYLAATKEVNMMLTSLRNVRKFLDC